MTTDNYTRIPIRKEEHRDLVLLQHNLTGKLDSYLSRPSLSDVIRYLIEKEKQTMTTNPQPNRKQFAETVAHAYFHQLGHVMGQPRVDYDPDTGKFSSGSNVNSTQYSDIEIMTIEEGGFGDIDVSEEGGEQALAEWIADDNDELWREVLATIEEETETVE